MKCVIVPDLHFPYTDRKGLDECLAYIKFFKPDYVVQIGDAYDFFAFSRFPKAYHAKALCASQEIAEGFDDLQTMWKTIRKSVPNAKLYQMRGNHCERLEKRIAEKMPELIGVFDLQIKSFWEFDGVHTIHDPRIPLIIDGIAFTHGWRTKLGDHSKYLLMPVVCAHSHRPGIFYQPLANGKVIWELNAGHLVDTEADALAYTPNKFTNWTKSFASFDAHGPRVHLV